MLHNDLVHLMRNVRKHVSMSKAATSQAWKYVNELAVAATNAEAMVIFEDIKQHNPKLHHYLYY